MADYSDGVEAGSCDSQLEDVAAALFALDPDGSKIGSVLRKTIDGLLDGEETGRYRWDQLYKTEKTHCGTLFEINLQRAFDFHGGAELDYEIAGIDVDCKFSQDLWKWMIPPEAVGKLCLVVWASDQKSRWCAGLVRPHEGILTGGTNRDSKRTLKLEGRSAVRRLFWDMLLPENTLLHLSVSDLEAILGQPSRQKGLDELFRRVQRRLISRNVVATVARQRDYMKRLRYNGGSRSNLQPEGIVIFGQYKSHQRAAADLGLAVPQGGESISARLARYRPGLHGDLPRTSLDGQDWVLAGPADPVERAPKLPQV
ncbi:NaeI family type II restriction endonuclease [Actinospica durhamensis]|uniref:NaeI family type II restriction endonuclease n=1 Tax=Actinospica durhamensis TaxID=1508375 RepID=A0A941IRD2_9ACTN|nr:NaeI family type II restriction endonuclease [Actinospica durhamensis]MBR7833818.1 NaeI family type II restriction endonuclease [Actinospica durhamensis]